MITFKQFLNESESSTEMAKYIESHCKPFLDESKRKGLLFRGIGTFAQSGEFNLPGLTDAIPFAIITPRVDRQPRNMPKKFHTLIDDWFKDKFGLKARSAGVFAFGVKSSNTAASYAASSNKGQGGFACVIFPIGPFKYVWSPEVHDLFTNVHDHFTNFSQMDYTKFSQMDYIIQDGENNGENNGEIDVKKFYHYLETLDYKSTDLSAALQSKNEIMLVCDKYLALSVPIKSTLREPYVKAIASELGINISR